MVRKRNLTEKEKEVIAFMYQNRNLSLGAIADALDVSIATVYNYRNYKIKD